MKLFGLNIDNTMFLRWVLSDSPGCQSRLEGKEPAVFAASRKLKTGPCGKPLILLTFDYLARFASANDTGNSLLYYVQISLFVTKVLILKRFR